MNYSMIVVVAIFIHLILNYDYFTNREEKNSINTDFKRYVWATMFYYVADAIWGIVYALRMPWVLYIDTIFYYITMAMTVVLLCRYVTTYLKLNTWYGRFINIFGQVFALFEVVLLFINHFVHIFFWIDDQGEYHAYTMRYLALYMLVLLCSLMAVGTGVALKRAKGKMIKRYFSIFLFCVEMTIAILAQILYPFQPLYSIGLLVGICIIYTFVKADEKEEQYKVLSSVGDIFYSMHVIDLVNDTVEEFRAVNDVKRIVNHHEGAKQMMVDIMTASTFEDSREAVLMFTDLSTIADRMKDKKMASLQFLGRNVGWTNAMFITIEADDDGRPTKVLYTTRVIDDEKKQEETLIRKSQTDDLTGLLNRRAYDEDVYTMEDIPDEFVYIALDVNGLKVVNDSIGHAAGDELIIGAADCMRKVLAPYGKIYRTGGDEFSAIVYIGADKILDLCEEFEEVVSAWKGRLVDSLSISYGYVSKAEYPDYTAPQFATEADHRMAKCKSVYYQKKGMDRRGQKDAHKALCDTYTKILKVNLTDDSYQIVNMSQEEKDSSKGFSERISTWLHDFGTSGQVYAEDLDSYLKKTDLSFMREYFKHNSTHIIIYRRKYGDKYKRVMMEMIPANDYSDVNQSLYLYVKSLEN